MTISGNVITFAIFDHVWNAASATATIGAYFEDGPLTMLLAVQLPVFEFGPPVCDETNA